MQIRPEATTDFDTIDDVVRAAFEGRDQEPRLVRAIRDSDGYVPKLALVFDDGEVVGHIMLSYVTLSGPDEKVLSLAPLSVRPDRQNEKIGDDLTREALRRADEMGAPLVVVLGIPSYYPRFGFEAARKHGIEPPTQDFPDEAFMIVRLSNYDPALRGTISYPSAFDETS